MNDTVLTEAIRTMLTLTVFICIFFIYQGYSEIVLDKKRLELETFKLNTEAQITIEIPKMLDELVSSTFKEYVILNEGFKKNNYVTSEDEYKITTELGDLIASRLSEAMYDKLSLYYKKEAIPTVIGEKIYMEVLGYSMSCNATKPTKIKPSSSTVVN